MFYADLLTVTEQGIRIPETALRPLGIYDGSTCWGLWYRRPGSTDETKCHLIISALHPRSWPFLLRLRIALRDEPGALERACRHLDEAGLSILLGECTEAGFGYAYLNVIAESTDPGLKRLKELKDQFDRRHPGMRSTGTSFSRARGIATEIAGRMMWHLRRTDLELERQLRTSEAERAAAAAGTEPPADAAEPAPDADASQPARTSVPLFSLFGDFMKDEQATSPFATRDIVELMTNRTELFRSREQAMKLLRAQLMPAFTVRYMHRLLRFAMYGGGSEVPIALRYDAASAMLRLERPGTFDVVHAPWDTLPCPAVVVFNSRDKYLRIDPAVPANAHNRLTRVAVDYAVNSPSTASPADDSRGLLWRVCRAFQDDRVAAAAPAADAGTQPCGATQPYLVNLRDMSVKWTYHSGTRRIGRITFIGDARPQDYARVQQNLDAFNHSQPRALPFASIEKVDIHQYPTARLFVSLHSGHPREAGLKQLLTDTARECGLDAGTVQTFTHPATGIVLDAIRQSQAFLQLLSFRAHEEPEQVNFTWLDFEYGVASGLGIPTMRLVDVVRRPYDWWRQRITTNPDQRAKVFRTDVGDAELRQVLRDALGELAAKLTPAGTVRSPGSGT